LKNFKAIGIQADDSVLSESKTVQARLWMRIGGWD
jgi:hypothetical protein